MELATANQESAVHALTGLFRDHVLSTCSCVPQVLEVASGTGYLGARLTKALFLIWQPSELSDEFFPFIEAARAEHDVHEDAFRAPFVLDATSNPSAWPGAREQAASEALEYDVLFCAHALHLMSPLAVDNLFAFASAQPSVQFVLLAGPFSHGGEFTSDRLANLHFALASSAFGRERGLAVPELDDVCALARAHGFVLHASERYGPTDVPDLEAVLLRRIGR